MEGLELPSTQWDDVSIWKQVRADSQSETGDPAS